MGHLDIYNKSQIRDNNRNLSKKSESEVINMAIYDWNKDGKKDMVDDFIEYQIYKNSMKQNTGNSSSGSSGSGTWLIGSIIFMIVLAILGFR